MNNRSIQLAAELQKVWKLEANVEDQKEQESYPGCIDGTEAPQCLQV